MSEKSKVAVLLCTYYGQAYLEDQLNSIAAQTYPCWGVYASDDGSEDGTISILETYQGEWKERLSLFSGPQQGFARNFLSLIYRKDITAEYYAYSDQDDIWESDKLERAVRWLDMIPKEVPALYCSRTRLVDCDNKEIGLSPLFLKKPCFENAIVQNIGGGNTMVINDAARKMICLSGHDVQIIAHDWWTYLVVSGCGGKIFYDEYPSLRYRQHGQNVVGTNIGWSARLLRMKLLWLGEFRRWNDINIQALRRLDDMLTPENRRILNQFVDARDRNLISRLMGLKRSGVYRQTALGNFGLMVAALLKKI